MNDFNNTAAIDFKLSEPFRNVAVKGDVVDIVDTVTLFAPSASNRKQVTAITSFVGPLFKRITESATEEQLEKAQKKAEEKKANKNAAGVEGEEEEESRFTGADFAQQATLMDVDDSKLYKAMDSFKRLIVDGGRAKIQEERFTDTLFERMNIHDLDNMFYEYSISFLLDSLLN